MRKPKQNKKPRKLLISKRKLRALARRIVRQEKYTLPEIIEMFRRGEKNKRNKGRPARANRDEILDAAAKAMAKKGEYAPVAARLGLTPRQLANLVQRNRAGFEKRVRQYKPTHKSPKSPEL